MSPKKSEGRFNESLELTCSYEKSDTDAQSFSWFRNDTQLADTFKDYSVEKQAYKSTLKIHHLKLDDENVLYRFGSIDGSGVKQIGCDFPKIQVLPELMTDRPEEKLTHDRITIRRQNGESIRFTCRLKTDADSKLIPKWEFGVHSENFHELPNGLIVQDNDVIIDSIGKQHQGYYRCTFADRDGESKVLLRMKDRFAAWWPFLGIVIVVIICVVIILLIEKRQKAAKKAAADASEDKTNDPLVSPTNKSNVEENKTSYVNA